MFQKNQKKYNNTEVKCGATFYGCHTFFDTCWCYICLEKSDSLEELKTAKLHEFADSFDWVCTCGIIKKVQYLWRLLVPAWAVLNSQHLKVLDLKIPKDEKNYHNTEVKYGVTFTAAT
jgi:hypothetical protein